MLHPLEPKLKLSSRLQTVLLDIQYLRNSKRSRIMADLNILKAPRKEPQTILIKKLTSISCSVTFQVFSCDSCFASGLLQIEIQVFSRLHRVCLLDSTIATCFRRIQAKFHRFYSKFPPPLSYPLSPPGNVLKKFEKITKAHRSRNVLSLM